jgi:hypothetical protein
MRSALAATSEQQPVVASGDDLDFVQRRLTSSVVWQRNKSLCRTIRDEILPRWKHDLPAPAWAKVRKRFVKELNEAEPCIQFVQSLVESSEPPVLIVDLCSGFGIFGMLLSELLPPDRVTGIWLLDRSYAMDQDQALPHHLSVDHIVQRSSSCWPIPLRIRKVDLRKPREKNQLHKYIFGASRTIFTGIHLCKALSVHAINLYHVHALTGLALGLILKPCCLPGKRKGNLLVWQLNAMETATRMRVPWKKAPAISTAAEEMRRPTDALMRGSSICEGVV